MAYNTNRNYGRNGYGRSGRNNYSKYTRVEKFAYMAGLVNKGRSNPNSKISDSYNAGINRANGSKKTLF